MPLIRQGDLVVHKKQDNLVSHPRPASRTPPTAEKSTGAAVGIPVHANVLLPLCFQVTDDFLESLLFRSVVQRQVTGHPGPVFRLSDWRGYHRRAPSGLLPIPSSPAKFGCLFGGEISCVI